MGKLLGVVAGSVVTLLAVFGGPLVWWWDRRPPGQPPPVAVHVLFWTWRVPFPESLKAQLARADVAADAANRRFAVQLADADRRAADAEASIATLRTQLAASDSRAEAAIRAQTKTLDQEVRDVIPPSVDLAYRVPAGFVRLHDAAALGSPLPSGPAVGGADDAPSPVAFSAVGAAVVDNYGECRADQARLVSLQALVRGFDLEVDKINAQGGDR